MDSLNTILLAINILLMVLVVVAIGVLKKYIDSVIELHNAVKDCFDVDTDLINNIIKSNDSVKAQCENTEKAYELVMKQYKSMQNSYDLVTKQYESMYDAYIKIMDYEDQRYNEFNITCSTEDSNNIPTVPVNIALSQEEVSLVNGRYDTSTETHNELY